MRILLVATRDPAGRQTGRKTVLNTILRMLTDLGHTVHVVVISRAPLEQTDRADGVSIERFRPPNPLRVVGSIATRATTGRATLNECLYDSPSLRRRVRVVAERRGVDIVVADMIRTAELALATAKPSIVDLDDLLSVRYADLAVGGAQGGTILGYFGQTLPSFVRRPAGRIAAQLVGWERRLAEKREPEIGTAADVVSLVARDEAERFSRVIGRPVAWLPMAVPVPATAAPVADNDPRRLVFVGGLDYHANLEAVRWFVSDVAPALERFGRGDARLRVVGYCPPAVARELESPCLELAGYVDDLGDELRRARLFVAPIRSGTGIKTKVLEAMAAGLPVVSTSEGIKGFGAQPGRDCLVGDTAESLADGVRALIDDGSRAAAIGTAGRMLVSELFTDAAVGRRWAQALDDAMANHRAER